MRLLTANGRMFSRSAARDALFLDYVDEKPKRNEVEAYRRIAALLGDDRGRNRKQARNKTQSGVSLASGRRTEHVPTGADKSSWAARETPRQAQDLPEAACPSAPSPA
jgi:hypothetical protein